ncbi:MAG: LysM peptidoglycan-binding domain-containing protein [Phycisphaerales bacterium]|nr:LysM peptidoglycan-binding domain-containing protein [Phycisphaerales bacterium]
MDHHGGKIATGLFALVVIWIIVFWLWQTAEPGISFGDANRHSEPARPSSPAGGSSTRPVLPDPIVEVPPRQTTEPTKPSPAEPSVPKTGVVAPEFIDYTVQPGDTFASIARRFYGSTGKAELIARANPLVDPTRIKNGRVLKIPKDPSNIQGKPVTAAPPSAPTQSPGPSPSAPAAGERRHTVERGDTLTSISKKYYGTIKKTDVILKANRNVLSKAEDLRPGQTLVIPPSP